MRFRGAARFESARLQVPLRPIAVLRRTHVRTIASGWGVCGVWLMCLTWPNYQHAIPRHELPHPRPARERRGIPLVVVLLVVVQLWLLTATMNAFLGGESGTVVPAALAGSRVSGSTLDCCGI